MRVSVIGDEGDSDSGFVGAHLRSSGAALELYLRDELDSVDPLAGSDLLVLLGSDRSVHDAAEGRTVAAEQAIVRVAEARGLPVLAICYGAQLVAAIHGAEVAPSPLPEIGWQTIESDHPELVGEGPWFELHYDRFGAIPGVATFARSAAAPQAFTFGRTLAVQFHPEVTPEMVGQWARAGARRLGSLGVDPEALIAETEAIAAAAERRCGELVDVFLAQVAERPFAPAL